MIAGGCRLCGGTAGDSRQTSHALCVARREMGEPTPSLGDACPCCGGSGSHPRSNVGPSNPTQDNLERWAPACVTCNASGAVRVADRSTDHMRAETAAKRLHWHDRCVPLAEKP